MDIISLQLVAVVYRYMLEKIQLKPQSYSQDKQATITNEEIHITQRILLQ